MINILHKSLTTEHTATTKDILEIINLCERNGLLKQSTTYGRTNISVYILGNHVYYVLRVKGELKALEYQHSYLSQL